MQPVMDPRAYGHAPRPPDPVARVVGSSKQTVFMDEKPRCVGFHKGRPCAKLLAEFVARPWSIQCSRCRTRNIRNTPAPAEP